ncbi:homoserine kinase [bacterium A37T11]|nr:homoserine kinase [bacterium A37T11]
MVCSENMIDNKKTKKLFFNADFRGEEEIRVFAPATVANMICGFDILGFALDEPGDEVIMRRVENSGVRISEITGDDGKLPRDASRNTVSACVQHMLNHLGLEFVGVEIVLHKHMPIGSGLGSSAASTVAGLFAVNELLGRPLSRQELLPFALKGEELACGHGHADNVAPALLGGITLIRSYEPLDVISLPVPPNLYCAVVFPHVEVKTREARMMVQNNISLQQAVVQWGNIAGLVSALYTNDFDLLSRSMQDILVEPFRAVLIPEFYGLRQLALNMGALCFGISGSGPSIFAFAHSRERAAEISTQLQEHLEKTGVGSNGYVSGINNVGPRIHGVI